MGKKKYKYNNKIVFKQFRQNRNYDTLHMLKNNVKYKHKN